VKFANDIAGIDTHIHAPVVSNYASSYISYALDNADPNIAVVDYHNYDLDPTTSINAVNATIASHNHDGNIEPVWNTEWGTYTSSYDTVSRAMTTARQLMIFSENEVQGITIFGMYDWGSFSGLLSTSREKTETYYAYRLMTRGLVNGKERIAHSTSDFLANTYIMITRDDDYVYVIVLRDNIGEMVTMTVDLSAIGSGSGSVEVWEYSAVHQDVIVETPPMINAQFSFTAPANGISLIQVSRSQLTPAINYYLPLIFR
jgi:hypothetical protein